LAQGILSGKYNKGIPEDSRAAKPTGFLQASQVTAERVEAARQLEEIANARHQTLAQMSLAWVLSDPRVTSVIIGTSSVNQLMTNISALDNLDFSEAELKIIDEIVQKPTISF
jgi:L-glyceraldehyde 3-phosphate reductase